MSQLDYSDPILARNRGVASPVNPNEQFYPIRSFSKTTDAWQKESQAAGPQPGSKLFDPYGVDSKNELYKRFSIYGGTRDLLKSIATRRLGIEDLMKESDRPDVPMGLQDALQQASLQMPGGQNKLSQEAFGNQQAGFATPFVQEGDQYKNQLRDLLFKSYVEGGGLYGGAYAAWAAAKGQSKAYDTAKTAQLQAIVGGVMKGLGLNQYGEADTTTGAIGTGEL